MLRSLKALEADTGCCRDWPYKVLFQCSRCVPVYSPLRRSPHRGLTRQRSDGTGPRFISGAHVHISASVYIISTSTCTLSGRTHVPYLDEHMYPIGTSTCTLSGRAQGNIGAGIPLLLLGGVRGQVRSAVA